VRSVGAAQGAPVRGTLPSDLNFTNSRNAESRAEWLGRLNRISSAAVEHLSG